MRLAFCALLCFSSLLYGANFKLYLSDGGFHLVREYKLDGDRVKYYSVERSDWEEIPTGLVDLKKTENEKTAHSAAQAEDAKLAAEEDTAIRAQRTEITKIPQDPGVYALDESLTLRIFDQGESKVHSNKSRTLLKVLSPIPLVPGKATVEIDGEKSKSTVNSGRPELFIQLSTEERFGIIRLTRAKGVRVAERLTIVPVSKEVIEEVDEVEIFRKQLTESGLFKIWPVKSLDPGEYAVIQYTSGKLNAQMWDFAYRP